MSFVELIDDHFWPLFFAGLWTTLVVAHYFERWLSRPRRS